MERRTVGSVTLVTVAAAKLFAASESLASVETEIELDALSKARALYTERCGEGMSDFLSWEELDEHHLRTLIKAIKKNIEFACVPAEFETMDGTVKNQGDGGLKIIIGLE